MSRFIRLSLGLIVVGGSVAATSVAAFADFVGPH
jgi:hypothetical protein